MAWMSSRASGADGATMRLLCGLLAFVLAALQLQLWLGDGGLRELRLLERQLAAQRSVNAGLEQRNRALEIEVVDLKTGLEAVEERARSELGMIEAGETFYLFVD